MLRGIIKPNYAQCFMRKSTTHSVTNETAKDNDSVTGRAWIERYIRWANLVREDWEYPAGGAVESVPSKGNLVRVDCEDSAGYRVEYVRPNGKDGVERNVFQMSENLKRAAKEIAREKLFRDPHLPPFGTRQQERPRDNPLLHLLKIADEQYLYEEDCLARWLKVSEPCLEMFKQYRAIQRIRRILRTLARYKPPKRSFKASFELEASTTFNVEINPRELPEVKRHIPEIYRLFIDAVEKVDISRIRRCRYCKNYYWANRYQSLTCSLRCRVNRWRKRYPEKTKDIQAKAELQRYYKEYPEKKKQEDTKLLKQDHGG